MFFFLNDEVNYLEKRCKINPFVGVDDSCMQLQCLASISKHTHICTIILFLFFIYVVVTLFYNVAHPLYDTHGIFMAFVIKFTTLFIVPQNSHGKIYLVVWLFFLPWQVVTKIVSGVFSSLSGENISKRFFQFDFFHVNSP